MLSANNNMQLTIHSEKRYIAVTRVVRYNKNAKNTYLFLIYDYMVHINTLVAIILASNMYILVLSVFIP